MQLRMKRYILFIISLLLISVSVYGDILSDKKISQISRDTKNYISAEVRGPSEEEAYQEALRQLTDQVTEYYKTLDDKSMPETIYLTNVSSHFERLITHSSDNRYRVLVYVKKSDLKPLSSDSNALILSKNDNDSYRVVTPEPPEPKVITLTDTIVEVVEKEVPVPRVIPKQVSKIALLTSEQEVNDILVNMRKANEITGAAAFPIASYGNFYVVVINRSNNLETILYFDGNNLTDAITGSAANPNDYRDCKAYWFTIQN